ncbi:MAG: YqaA family protein [Vibrionaceae bacterium]
MPDFSQPWLLFSSGFLSATLLPGGSEAHYLFALSLKSNAPALLFASVTLGNALGGIFNYWLGRLLPARKLQAKRRETLARRGLERYGDWALLFSWLPLIGDPLCVLAGWYRLSSLRCALFITAGKGLRFALLTALFLLS